MKLTKLERVFLRILPDYPNHIEFAGTILLHGGSRDHNKFVYETIGMQDYWITSWETYQEIKTKLEKEPK